VVALLVFRPGASANAARISTITHRSADLVYRVTSIRIMAMDSTVFICFIINYI